MQFSNYITGRKRQRITDLAGSTRHVSFFLGFFQTRRIVLLTFVGKVTEQIQLYFSPRVFSHLLLYLPENNTLANQLQRLGQETGYKENSAPYFTSLWILWLGAKTITTQLAKFSLMRPAALHAIIRVIAGNYVILTASYGLQPAFLIHRIIW